METNSTSHPLRPIKTRRHETAGGDIDSLEEEIAEEPVSPLAQVMFQSGLHIIFIIGLKDTIDPHSLKVNLEQTLLKHPRFSSIMDVDKKKRKEMRWIPAKMDMENHLIVPIIDPKMDLPDAFVEDYISHLSKTTLNASNPLWELHVLNIKTSNQAAGCTAVFKIHHCLGDGISLVSLLLACTRQTANPEALPTIRGTNKNIVHSKGFWEHFQGLWTSIIIFINTIMDVLMFIATMFFLKDTKTPLSTKNTGQSSPRFVHRIVSLDDIKLVKNAMKVTVNDVLIAITQAGLSQYLNKRYAKECNGGMQKTNNLPSSIRFRSNVAINLRQSPSLQAFQNMMEEGCKVKWGNCIGYILLPLKIALFDDPLDYVREAKVIMDRKKHSLESKVTYYFTNLCANSFCSKALGTLMGRVQSQVTMGMSNLVGPSEDISFYGNPITHLAPSAFGLPLPMGFHYLSYVNKVSFVLTADETAIPDPHQLCNELEESLKHMKDAVLASIPVKE